MLIKSPKVYIDPLVDVYYSSFHLKGLFELYGNENIFFDSAPFKELKQSRSNFNFIVNNNSAEIKYSISLDDSPEVKTENYNWCSVYGSVNANRSEIPEEFNEKLISLAPSFGIRIWNIADTISHSISNLIKIDQKINLKRFLGRYKKQYLLRMPLDYYYREAPVPNYIFHASTLWQSGEGAENDDNVNRIRAIFMDVCKAIPGIDFEGGFFYSGNHPLNENFRHLILKEYIHTKEYIDKIRKSVVVFNTPAWINCNGWKLGEYLALGKAIISTPLINDLPEALVHGENVHFVSDDPAEIKDAVIKITRDERYRKRISEGAYDYYLRNATPVKSLELLGIHL